MKILIDAHLSENKITGIGRYLNGLIPSIVRLDQSNDYIFLLRDDLEQDHPLMRIAGPRISKIPVKIKGIHPLNHYRLSKLIRKIDPDVYHHPHFDLPLLHHIKSVITVHDLKYVRNPHFFPEFSNLKKFYMKRMMRHAARRANRIITASVSTKNDLLNLIKISEDKIDVVYHGLEEHLRTHFEEQECRDVLRQYGIDGDFILFVGERRPHKNIPNLIRSYKILKNNLHDNIKLVIIGKKYLNYDIPESMVNDAGEGQIVIADAVTDDELVVFYQKARLLILPSYYEGFGFPLIEAMSRRVPVIAANNTSMIEVVGDAGLLVDPDSPDEIAAASERLLTDGELRQKLIRSGLDRVTEFNWDRSAAQTIEVYNKVYFG
ncbi:glycosyltransferase family 4 protein [candidate division KSB1 bacterium]|nr:glycosyltransferase family 4 protein [candidate division KSB1 bacterium]